jgi:hypothetical protein
MNSRISIDVDHDNQPVIKIEYKDSDDVRDKLVKKFLETYGHASRWSVSEYQPNPPGTTLNSVMLIRPITPENMDIQGNEMKSMFNYAYPVKTPKK